MKTMLNFLIKVKIGFNILHVVFVLTRCSSIVTKLNTNELSLNTTAMVVHGVELYKDQTGVTAKMSASTYVVSVHFDGSTAHIRATGTI